MTHVVEIIGSIIALGTLIKAVYEYTRERLEKRAQQFLDLRKYFREKKDFQDIIAEMYNEKGPPDYSSIPHTSKIEFMAFFEDLAFMMNSGLMKKEVVFYMFGGDAINAYDNESFWGGKLKNDEEWGLLTDFVKEMKELREGYRFEKNKMSL